MQITQGIITWLISRGDVQKILKFFFYNKYSLNVQKLLLKMPSNFKFKQKKFEPSWLSGMSSGSGASHTSSNSNQGKNRFVSLVLLVALRRSLYFRCTLAVKVVFPTNKEEETKSRGENSTTQLTSSSPSISS